MANTSYPGVYIQEAAPGPGPIQGVSPSGLGLVGFTPRGVANYPTLCTSYPDFASKFGTFTASSLTPTMAYIFFANGGQQLWQVRVVHPDAVKSHIDWVVSVTGEILTSTATPSGAYSLDTTKIPVVATVPGTVVVEFQAAATNNIFRDDGVGNLVFVPVGSGGAGGSGSIDYTTGEISVQLTTPGNFIGGADDVTVNYSYKVATYTMAWEGLAGNYIRVRVTGSPDYYVRATASYTAFTLYVEENVTPTATATWETKETFDAVVFDDPTDPKYFVNVINDSLKGSDLITVTAYGNAQDIAGLAGAAVTAENFAAGQVPAYNGLVKQFAYTLPTGSTEGIASGTLSMAFKFTESGLRIGTGDGTAAPVCTALGYRIDAGGGTASTANVTVNLTLTVGGATVLYDDGVGNLRTSPFPGVIHGTIVYTTGAVTLNIAGTTVVAGTAITIAAVYEDAVTVVDDGDGNMAVQAPAVGVTPPLKFQLNSNGTNTVAYDTGVVTLTWKIVGAPALGPAGVDVSASPATFVGPVGPYTLAPGASFNLDVDNVGMAVVTFTASAGRLTESSVWGAGLALDNLTTIIAIDGVNQTIAFTPPLGGVWAVADAINAVNAQITGAFASLDVANMRVTSDTKGTASSVAHVAGGTADALLLWANPPVAGAGNVGDITAVTANEVETIVEAATTAEVTVAGGAYTMLSPTTGLTSELDFQSNLAGLGISIQIITGSTGTTGETATYYTQAGTQVTYTMVSGTDGSATDRTDVSAATLEADYKGIYAYKRISENLQLVIADFQTDEAVCRDIMGFSELLTDKFAICSAPEGLTYQEAVNWKKFTLNRYSNYAALYYPHVKITDPVTNNTMLVPPGAHIAGIIARTDSNRNVGKAPAGTTDGKLSYFEGLEVSLQASEVGYCRQNNLNTLIDWERTGTIVWGANTMETPGAPMIYIQQRRTFMYVEKSVFNATHVHVFENNGPALWTAIRTQVTSFLMLLTQANYFASTEPASAFFVVCDSTNNNQGTIDAGLVYVDVGLACNKPAEFIVFTFAMMSSSTQG